CRNPGSAHGIARSPPWCDTQSSADRAPPADRCRRLRSTSARSRNIPASGCPAPTTSGSCHARRFRARRRGSLLSFRHRNSPVTIWSGPPTHDTVRATPQASEAADGANVDPEAQDLYLKGRYYWDKRTPDDLNKAVDFFTQASIRDPNYAQAYVGLADCYNLLREYAAMTPEEAYPRALAAAKTAVELDDSSAEAHNSLAFVTFYWNWDVAGAEREFRRALELNPTYVVAHHWYATFLMTIGRLPEALEQID